MSMKTLKEYYDYMPIFLVSGLDLVLGKEVNQGFPAKEIRARNQSLTDIARLAIVDLAYAEIFHLAPSLGYTIP